MSNNPTAIVVENLTKPTGPKVPVFLAQTWSDEFGRWAYATFYVQEKAEHWAKGGREGQVYRISFEDNVEAVKAKEGADGK